MAENEDVLADPGGRRGVSGYVRVLAGLVITAACIGIIAWRIDFHQVAAAIAEFKWPYLLLAALALSIDYAVRIFRWSIMLRATGAESSFYRCAAPFLGSIALNNVLPARLGDVIRALVFPGALGITKTASTGSLVLERLLDLATLLGLLSIALLAVPNAQLPDSIKLSVTILAFITLLGLVIVVAFSGVFAQICLRWSQRDLGRFPPVTGRLLLGASALLSSFSSMSRLRALGIVVALSVIVWVGEAGFFWAFLAGFGISFSPAAAALVMAVATLATLVPSSPGYVGPFHLAAFAAITILGSSPEVAASFAVLTHAGIWLLTTLVGAIAILCNPGLFAGAAPTLRGHPARSQPARRISGDSFPER